MSPLSLDAEAHAKRAAAVKSMLVDDLLATWDLTEWEVTREPVRVPSDKPYAEYKQGPVIEVRLVFRERES